MMPLGSQIKHHRLRLGLTLEQLSSLSGVELGTISALEVRDSCRSKFASAIARAFGMTVEELEGGAPPVKSSATNEPPSHYVLRRTKKPELTTDEQQLLSGYRAAGSDVRRIMLAAAREALHVFPTRGENHNH